MAEKSPLPAAPTRVVSVAAMCCPKSVTSYLLGTRKTQPMLRQRIEMALRAAGFAHLIRCDDK